MGRIYKWRDALSDALHLHEIQEQLAQPKTPSERELSPKATEGDCGTYAFTNYLILSVIVSMRNSPSVSYADSSISEGALGLVIFHCAQNACTFAEVLIHQKTSVKSRVESKHGQQSAKQIQRQTDKAFLQRVCFLGFGGIGPHFCPLLFAFWRFLILLTCLSIFIAS